MTPAQSRRTFEDAPVLDTSNQWFLRIHWESSVSDTDTTHVGSVQPIENASRASIPAGITVLVLLEWILISLQQHERIISGIKDLPRSLYCVFIVYHISSCQSSWRCLGQRPHLLLCYVIFQDLYLLCVDADCSLSVKTLLGLLKCFPHSFEWLVWYISWFPLKAYWEWRLYLQSLESFLSIVHMVVILKSLHQNWYFLHVAQNILLMFLSAAVSFSPETENLPALQAHLIHYHWGNT